MVVIQKAKLLLIIMLLMQKEEEALDVCFLWLFCMGEERRIEVTFNKGI